MANGTGKESKGKGVGVVRFDIHRVIEATIGMVLILLPFVLAFSPSEVLDLPTTVLVVAGVIGAVAATLGFLGGRSGNPMPLGLHFALDVVLTVALIGAALFFAYGGETSATVLFASAGLAYALLSALTRYSREPGDAEPRAER